jgi:aryl sulfotransferase
VYRYTSADEDSARWEGFGFRDGDIVISTRSKTGTTWMQTICALLIFQTPALPAPLGQISPWVDWLVTPLDQVIARLEAQRHRRFVKTHTPLDGIPLDPRASYIVMGRHPLDMAVSLYHQMDNIDRAVMARLIGQPAPSGPPRARRPLREWLMRWVDSTADPREEMDSLPGVMAHLSDAWGRRGGSPDVWLVHYDDLQADLEGEMRRLALRLGISVAEESWPGLVEAATFGSMRADAARRIPAPGIMKSNAAFFRRGTSGAGAEVLSDEEMAHYRARAAELAPADLLAWLHRESPAA